MRTRELLVTMLLSHQRSSDLETALFERLSLPTTVIDDVSKHNHHSNWDPTTSIAFTMGSDNAPKGIPPSPPLSRHSRSP
ncbi:hypothetical protein EV126DRAFT_356608 [Verticillium dahliae]|nr:hypothetical protein EV126DRAFT_356608 [Verticillium dahliae]